MISGRDQIINQAPKGPWTLEFQKRTFADDDEWKKYWTYLKTYYIFEKKRKKRSRKVVFGKDNGHLQHEFYIVKERMQSMLAIS